MIQQTEIAKRYAKALFELAQAYEMVSATEQQLREIAMVLTDNNQLYVLLTSPNIGLADKMEVLDVTFRHHVSAIVARTLQLLVERRRIHLIYQLVDSYIRMAGEAAGVLNATVTTAYLLNKFEIKAVAIQFSRKYGKSIRVKNVVKPEIIGGMVVRIGDRLYDGSIASKLERMHCALKAEI